MHLVPPHRPLPDHNPRLRNGSTHLDLDACLTVAKSQQLAFPLRFGYKSRDPFTATLESRAPTGTVVIWRISRDLLWEGLQRPAGQGDVRIWPPCPCHNRPKLRIVLRGREATAIVDVPAAPLVRWLSTEVFDLVPQGTEADLIDWDTELNHLIHGSN